MQHVYGRKEGCVQAGGWLAFFGERRRFEDRVFQGGWEPFEGIGKEDFFLLKREETGVTAIWITGLLLLLFFIIGLLLFLLRSPNYFYFSSPDCFFFHLDHMTAASKDCHGE